MQLKKDTVLFWLVLLFISTLFFPNFPLYGGVITALFVLFCLLSCSFKQKIILFKERKHLWGMLGFFIMVLISAFLSGNRKEGISNIDPRLPLLYFPVSVGLLNINRENRNKILLGIALLVTIVCIACLGWAIHKYRETGNSAWLYNDALTDLINQQSIYISLLVNTSIYIFGYFIFFSGLAEGKKFLLVVAAAFLYIFSFLLASRNLMLMLYPTTFVFLFTLIIKRKKYLEGVTLLMGLTIAGFLAFKFFPKTFNRYKELAFTQFNYEHIGKESHYADSLTADQWNGANFRLAAWPCGWQLFKEHPVLGVGIGDKKQELFKVYEQKQFHFALDTRKNVHNNYLDILLSMGISGFLFFIIGWFIVPAIFCFKNKDGLSLIILLTIAVAMLTENYFDRSLGGMLVGFFIPFLLSGSRKAFKEQTDQ